MDKDILTRLLFNEAVALAVIEPFYLARFLQLRTSCFLNMMPRGLAPLILMLRA